MKDWEPRLVAWLASVRARPFAPGAHDCGLFTAGALEAMTGVDHGAAWRGRYKTLKGARRLLKKAGYADHVAYVAGLFDEVPPAFAQAGDIAVIDGDDGPALGIVQGEGVYVLTPACGLGLVPRRQMKRAFRV